MITKGKNLLLKMGANDENSLETSCHSRSCTLSRARDLVETSGPEGPDRRFLASYKGGTISCDNLVAYTDKISPLDIIKWFEAGNPVYFAFAHNSVGGLMYSGQMIVNTYELTGEFTNYATFSFTATITGPLAIKELPILTTVYLGDSNKVRLAGCPNPYPVSLYYYGTDGNTPGTLIGVAFNADDLMEKFNSFPENVNYRLTGYSGGCDFNMEAKWNAPFVPTVVFAEASPGTGMWTGFGIEGVSPDTENDELLTPIA